MNDVSVKWEPMWVYTISDVTTDTIVLTVNADEIEIMTGTHLVHFKDRDGHTVLLHHLSPGHSLTVTNKGGYSLQECP